MSTTAPAIERSPDDTRKASRVTWMSTLAFVVCFAVWTVYSILAIQIQEDFGLTAAQFGTLLGAPILTGSLLRVPMAMLADRYGGRIVFTLLLLFVAIPTFLLQFASAYDHFVWLGMGFGMAGTGFAVGVTYVSKWNPAQKQGTALGIFGMGNAGSALTTLAVPFLLAAIGNWRTITVIYSVALVVMAVLFYFTTYDKPEHHVVGLTLGQRLAPLKQVRVWRFSLYYFVVFGAFVALGLWLPSYYKNVYHASLEQIAVITMAFLIPASLVRAFGGWLADRFGARRVMYWVLGVCVLTSGLIAIPPSEYTLLTVPYQYQASSVDETVSYNLTYNKFKKKVIAKVVAVGGTEGEGPVEQLRAANPALDQELTAYLKTVEAGETLPDYSRRTVHIGVDVVWFTALIFLLGVAMGIGMAAVYRYIPDYFPKEVGIVGGLVGQIGGLGGFVLPILWGYMLDWTGVQPIVYLFIFAISLVSLLWLHHVVTRFMIPKEARLAHAIEEHH